MNFVNLTPHDVNLCDEYGNVIRRYPKSGIVARVNEIVENHKFEGIPEGEYFPIVKKSYGKIENLPEFDYEKKITYIVSVLVLNAIKEKRGFCRDCICPDTGPDSAVRDSQGNIIGIKRFQINN